MLELGDGSSNSYVELRFFLRPILFSVSEVAEDLESAHPYPTRVFANFGVDDVSKGRYEGQNWVRQPVAVVSAVFVFVFRS